MHLSGLASTFLVKAVKILLIALLYGFPVLGEAADDWPASNWIWQLPGERQGLEPGTVLPASDVTIRSFTGLLTDPQFRMVVRELENRELEKRRVELRSFLDFKSRFPGPLGQDALHPSGAIINSRRGRQSIEAAEILNSLRMDRYRQDCERLKHTEMRGTPALYPSQIPWLGSP